jgi:hypothetical protein
MIIILGLVGNSFSLFVFILLNNKQKKDARNRWWESYIYLFIIIHKKIKNSNNFTWSTHRSHQLLAILAVVDNLIIVITIGGVIPNQMYTLNFSTDKLESVIIEFFYVTLCALSSWFVLFFKSKTYWLKYHNF